jgi:hypothetical protein
MVLPSSVLRHRASSSGQNKTIEDMSRRHRAQLARDQKKSGERQRGKSGYRIPGFALDHSG